MTATWSMGVVSLRPFAPSLFSFLPFQTFWLKLYPHVLHPRNAQALNFSQSWEIFEIKELYSIISCHSFSQCLLHSQHFPLFLFEYLFQPCNWVLWWWQTWQEPCFIHLVFPVAGILQIHNNTCWLNEKLNQLLVCQYTQKYSQCSS